MSELERLKAALTPSIETKCAYMGEFHFESERCNPDWGEDDEPEFITERHTVPWDTVKAIMAAILKHADVTL